MTTLWDAIEPRRACIVGIIVSGWAISWGTGPLRAQTPSASPTTHQAYAEPKTCFVRTAKASVRCGPGPQFYTTMIMQLGAPVEVYVETSDGWSGIRPPPGSHNWIPANSAYVLPGGKSAEVSVDKTPAFVGSDSPDVESLLYQTELVQTQSVALLGEAQRDEDGKTSLWFQIAPPQGEFRWIRSSQLGTDPVANPNPNTNTPNTNTPNTNTANTNTANTNPPAAKPDVSLAQAQVDPSTNEDSVQQASYDAQIPDGDVAWSDEAEQIARVEREIEREQALIAQQTPGPPGEGNPAKAKRNKSSRASAYQQDQKYWNTLNGPNSHPLKVGPVSGVLGWIGVSVVEDTPTPAAPAGRSTSASSWLGRRGSYAPQSPLIDNRLDRLPRPSRRYADGSWMSVLKSEGPLFGAQTPSPGDLTDSFASDPSRPLDLPIAQASFGSQPNDGSAALAPPERFQTPAIQDTLLQLSAMVAKPTEQWNLEPFRVSAKSWIELGETPLIRGEARLLLDRVEEFESLRRRSISIQSPPSLQATPMTEAVPARVAESGSEASGWLVSIVTSLPGQPEFALTDDAGKIIAYVRPTTGLNLRRYVQQPVVVYGAPGYIPNLAAKQIVAERVVRLR